jgi:hypothetical protein
MGRLRPRHRSPEGRAVAFPQGSYHTGCTRSHLAAPWTNEQRDLDSSLNPEAPNAMRGRVPPPPMTSGAESASAVAELERCRAEQFAVVPMAGS